MLCAQDLQAAGIPLSFYAWGIPEGETLVHRADSPFVISQQSFPTVSRRCPAKLFPVSQILPLPEPIPLTFVVGAPIPPPLRMEGAPATEEEVCSRCRCLRSQRSSHLITCSLSSQVEALHAKYYAALVELFSAHKAAAGYPDASLVLKNDHAVV